MFSKPLLQESLRPNRRSSKEDHTDFYVNFFTVGPIKEDTQCVTGMII